MIQTEKRLFCLLKIKPNELDELIRNIDRCYYEKVVLKTYKDGTPKLDKNGIQSKRILHPSINHLRTVQNRILRSILSSLPIPEYAYGAIKKKDNIKNAKRHQGKKYIFTTDLKDFFPSITRHHVFEMFRSFNFSPTVSRILTQLTTYKGRLPQGTPTSPLIANLVFIKTGRKLQQFAVQFNLVFTTFIDDLTFSSSVDFKDKVPEIIKIIQSDGFKISHNKTNYKTMNPVVTGIIVKNNNLALTASLKTKMTETADKSAEQIHGLNSYAERVRKA